jgi:hypothetical protein
VNERFFHNGRSVEPSRWSRCSARPTASQTSCRAHDRFLLRFARHVQEDFRFAMLEAQSASQRTTLRSPRSRLERRRACRSRRCCAARRPAPRARPRQIIASDRRYRRAPRCCGGRPPAARSRRGRSA